MKKIWKFVVGDGAAYLAFIILFLFIVLVFSLSACTFRPAEDFIFYQELDCDQS